MNYQKCLQNCTSTFHTSKAVIERDTLKLSGSKKAIILEYILKFFFFSLELHYIQSRNVYFEGFESLLGYQEKN